MSDEVEITPEMIEAGAEVIWRSFGDTIPYQSEFARCVADEVYRAMKEAVANV
jgi:hypothetical protein